MESQFILCTLPFIDDTVCVNNIDNKTLISFKWMNKSKYCTFIVAISVNIIYLNSPDFCWLLTIIRTFSRVITL